MKSLCMLVLASGLLIISACAHQVQRYPSGTAYTSHMIEGRGTAKPEDMAAFMVMKNRNIDRDLALEIALIYLEEARAENINHDVAFAQMCIETGFLSFRGLALPEQNNFCGLGVIDYARRGESFPDKRLGIRAHIQHLKAYATTAPPVNEIVDPRYRYVRKGSAKYVFQLTGTWATDPAYGAKVDRLASEIREYSRQNRIQSPNTINRR